MWWNRFGPMFAGEIRRQRVSRMRGFRHWRWHLDEMYVKLNGEMVYLWRAVDHEGEVLESYITKTRDKDAALTFMKKALKRHGPPEAITTDGLRSYRAAMKELGNADKQEVGRWANNRVENSHLPFRRRERAMLRFRRMKQLTEVRLRSRQRPQPLQSRTPPRRPHDLQGTTLCRPGGVADRRELGPCPQSPSSIVWRRVRIRLTAPFCLDLPGERQPHQAWADAWQRRSNQCSPLVAQLRRRHRRQRRQLLLQRAHAATAATGRMR